MDVKRNWKLLGLIILVLVVFGAVYLSVIDKKDPERINNNQNIITSVQLEIDSRNPFSNTIILVQENLDTSLKHIYFEESDDLIKTKKSLKSNMIS